MGILKNEHKWSDNISNKKQKSHSGTSPAASSPSTPQLVNLGNDNDDFSHHERPMGQKVAKKKKKNRLADEVEEMAAARVLDQYRLQKLEIEQEISARQERALAQHERQLEHEECMREDHIMEMDTTAMDPISAQYYNNEKM